MPTAYLTKVHTYCNIPMEELEKKWAYAKHRAGVDGKGIPRWGIVTNLFKESLPADCRKKLGYMKHIKKKEPLTEGKRYVAVDFDHTLSKPSPGKYNPFKPGEPIKPMLDRVKKWLAAGIAVKVMTARDTEQLRRPVKTWLKKYLGRELPITSSKDPNMISLWDDRAVQVQKDTGKPLGDPSKIEGQPSY